MNQIKDFWNKIDPKLKYTILSAAVTYALTKAAINLDPALSAIITGFVASLVGYNVENDGSVLRSMPLQSSGEDAGGLTVDLNQVITEDEMAPASAPGLVPPIDDEVDLPLPEAIEV